MSQKRILDYAAPVTALAINEINKAKSVSGILSPLTNIVEVLGPSVLKVNAHTLITPDGVIVINTTSENINFTLSSAPKTYTILFRHVYVNSSGGTAGQIEMIDSLFPVNYFSDATVLSWIQYPGGSVSLDSTMISAPRALKIVEQSDDDTPVFSATAPFQTKWLEMTTDAGLVTSSAFSFGRAYTQVFNSNTVIRNMTRVIPVVAGKYPPQAIRITAKADFQAGLVVSLFDENGTEYFPTNNIISNTDWGVFYMKFPSFNGLNVFKPHSTYKVKLSFQLSPTKNFYLEAVDLVDFGLPVTPNNTVVEFDYPYTFARLSSVISRWNPITGLPTSPTVGDRYLSLSTGNGWNANDIREWTGTVWSPTVAVKGQVVQVVGELADYVYNGIVWVKEIAKHKINV